MRKLMLEIVKQREHFITNTSFLKKHSIVLFKELKNLIITLEGERKFEFSFLN
jgi:hypothetical protein